MVQLERRWHLPVSSLRHHRNPGSYIFVHHFLLHTPNLTGKALFASTLPLSLLFAFGNRGPFFQHVDLSLHTVSDDVQSCCQGGKKENRNGKSKGPGHTLDDTERLLLLIIRVREFPHRGFALDVDQ